jgi:GAF domain-containing protein/two-component sensor histidine kinase
MAVDPTQVTIASHHEGLLSTLRGILLREEDMAALGQATCETLASSLNYCAVWLARIEEHDRRAQIIGSAGDRSDLQEKILPQDAVAESPGKSVGSPKIVTQSIYVDEDRNHAIEHARIPIYHAGEIIGELHTCLDSQPHYPEDELYLLEFIASDIAAGITRIHLDQQRKRLVKEVESLRDLGAEMISGREKQALFQILVQQVTQLLQGQSGGLYVCEPDKMQVRCVVSYLTDRDYVGVVMPYGEGAAGVVAATGEPLIIPDYGQWQKRSEKFSSADIHAVMSAPMRWQGQVTGVIHVMRDRDAPPFTLADQELLLLYANQAAVVLENARLLEAIRRRVFQLDQLTDISRSAVLAESTNDLIPSFIQKLKTMMGADQCAFYRWDPAHTKFIHFGGDATSSEANDQSGMLVEKHSLIEAALEAGHPLIADKADGSPYYPVQLGDAWDAKTMLAAPVSDGKNWQGVAVLGYCDETNIRQDEMELVEQATAQTALTIARMSTLETERRRTRALEGLREASLSLTSKLEISAVLESILSNALAMVAADDAHIFLYDKNELRFGAAKWAVGEGNRPFATPREDGLTYAVAQSGEAIVVPDVNQHDLFKGTNWGGAIVGLPLKVREKVVGVMNVAFLTPHNFDETELVALGLLADQAAIMIQNAHLFENVDKERRFVQLIYDVAQELVNTLSQDEILQRAVSLTAVHLNARSCEAFILDHGKGILVPRASARDDELDLEALQAKITLELGEGLVGWVGQAGQPVLIGDVMNDDRWVSVPGVDDEVRSAICAPLIAGGEMLGVMGVYHADKDVFTVEHLDLLVAIARQVSVAVSNAQRYAQIDRRLTEMTVVRQVVQVVNRRLEMQALLDEAVHQVGAVLGYPVVEVYLVEEHFLVLGAAHGGPFDPDTRYHMSEGILGRVVRTNRAAFVPVVAEDPDYIVGFQETACEIAVPLRVEGVAIGVLNVESPRPGDLAEEDTRLLMLLADQLAVAIENAALYERVRSHAESLESVVARRTSELAEALIRAQSADRLKTQFVSDVSHELRTPLSNIRLYLDLLRKGQKDRFDDYMRTLNRETNRLVNLIEDLLAISRLDAGTVTPHPSSFNLNVLGRGLVEDRRRLFGDRDLTLGLSLQSDLPNVVADEQMISQVIANLMTNALNYTPAGGSVTLITRNITKDGGKWVTLAVRDTGLGIPEKEREQVFERFFRGETSRKMGTPGTGLGLSICKEILLRHKGTITLESEEQKGSTFTIWLPISSPQAEKAT